MSKYIKILFFIPAIFFVAVGEVCASQVRHWDKNLSGEALNNHERMRVHYRENCQNGSGGIIFAKTFSFGSFSFWSQKENERYFTVAIRNNGVVNAPLA